MAFSGWPAEAVEFFQGLAVDNSRAYWTAHRPIYDACVHAPMVELLAELAGEFGPGRIARPYHDVRFRTERSPYKTAIYATLEAGGYVKFSAEGLTAGLGYYRMDADQLNRYRREDLPMAPTAVKGRVRARMWNEALAAHNAGRVRVAEVRAVDFLGAGAQSVYTLMVAPQLLAGEPAVYPGDLDVPHSWTYTGDVARTLVAISQDDRAWGRAWHVPSTATVSARPVDAPR